MNRSDILYKLLTTATTDSSTISISDQATKKLNAFERYWEGINWDHIFSLIIARVIYLVLIIFLFVFLKKGGKAMIEHFYSRYKEKSTLSENRLDTVHTLITNIYYYTLFFFFLYAILATLGVPVGSLLAGAGILGVAIGLGAQGFMNDIITGLFIILEQQMDVGDYIQLVDLGLEGTVVSIGIRSVQIQSYDGTLHFIPNRNITTISNQSREHMQVLIDIRIIPSEGYDQMRKIVEAANQKLAKSFAKEITKGPILFGLVDIGNGNFAIRTNTYVTNGNQFKIKEEFLATYVQDLTAAGFTIPNTPIIGK